MSASAIVERFHVLNPVPYIGGPGRRHATFDMGAWAQCQLDELHHQAALVEAALETAYVAGRMVEWYRRPPGTVGARRGEPPPLEWDL